MYSNGAPAMARLTQLAQVLFPVEEHPVLVKVSCQDGERLLSAPDKKAIVNTASQQVVGVVSRGYRLVSNREALDWCYQCCIAAFPKTQSSEWRASAVDAPGTGGHCFIDLTHSSTIINLDFSAVSAKDRPDIYGPFVRVSNSYNGLRALCFNVGFYRKVCTNGMIAPDAIIRFKFTHSRQEIGSTITFDVDHERLEKLKSSYKDYFDALRSCIVRKDELVPLVLGVFYFRVPRQLNSQSRESKQWADLTGYVTALCSRYCQDLGENAYCVFNVITDFATHPPLYVRRDRNSLQQFAGRWLLEFSKKCGEPDFKLSDYLCALSKKTDTRQDIMTGSS
jgi:hypothetical protein